MQNDDAIHKIAQVSKKLLNTHEKTVQSQSTW